jgi:hypothetical protein
LGEKAGVPKSTAHRYISIFPANFRARKVGRSVLYQSDGAAILSQISKMFADGLDRAQVEEGV